jgi:hypothetical protein
VTAPSQKDRSPLAALVLGWVLPGAGHAYAGRWGKAVLFFSLITALVVAGLVIGKGTNILPNRLWYAAQVCAGGPAIALTPISQYLAGPNDSNIDWADPLHEMGTLYTAVAGFLNLLVMMDAYTRLAYPRRPEEQQEGA